MEMDPDAIWKGFVTVVKGAVQGMVAQLFLLLHLQVLLSRVFSPTVLYAGMDIQKSPIGINLGRLLKPVGKSSVSNR